MRFLTTGWSAYTIWRTVDMKIRMDHLVVNPDTPCHADLFPGYFSTRLAFQVRSSFVHYVALLTVSIDPGPYLECVCPSSHHDSRLALTQGAKGQIAVLTLL